MKKVQRRAPRDYSQALRRTFQLAFLLLNLVLGVQFHLFVRYYETGGASLRVERPPGVEGRLPIASLMNLKAYLLSGYLPAIHPAGMFLLVAFPAASFFFRKSFCGWPCPIGTLPEYLWRLGKSYSAATSHCQMGGPWPWVPCRSKGFAGSSRARTDWLKMSRCSTSSGIWGLPARATTQAVVVASVWLRALRGLDEQMRIRGPHASAV